MDAAEVPSGPGHALDYGKASLGDGSGLVAVEEAQASCGLDAVDLVDEHIVLGHPDALVREQYRGEHREPLGDGADHDGDGNGDCIEDEGEPVSEVVRGCSGDEGLEENAGDDASGAPVAELRDLLREPGELHLERSPAGVLLHLERELSEHGLVADDFYHHVALALADNGAAVDEVFVEKVLRVIRGALGARGLLRLLGLTVEAGLIHLYAALGNLAVSADFVS